MYKVSFVLVLCTTSVLTSTLVRAFEENSSYSDSSFESPLNSIISQYKSRLKRSPQNGSKACILPPYPQNGEYSVAGTNAVPGQALDNALLNVTCAPGFQLLGTTNLYCISGKWSDSLPKCVRFCRLSKHPSVKYNCLKSGGSFQAGHRECDEYEPPGTVVQPECRTPNYYHTGGVLSYMRCLDNGWDYVAICTPECGRITPDGETLVVGGRRARRGEFPWHAGIYTKATKPYMQICGGSIVSTTVVISAAHCFWDKTQEKIFPASRYAVAAGKLFRPLNEVNDVGAQKSDVSELRIPIRFQGNAANYQDDIALVILSTRLEYQTYVRPVCIDFDKIFERRQLHEGKVGKVAGWGLTETGKSSPVLKVLDMPYVRISQCIEEAPRDFREYINSDKICAGYRNGSAVCHGDSGGGLVFPELDRGNERYYLRGIVSTSPASDAACNAFAYTTFTQISSHRVFIEENVATLLGDSNQQQQQSPFCILPPYPKRGRYVVEGNPNTEPGQAFQAVQLNVVCDPGYEVDENRTISCTDGKWSANMPKCVRFCTLTRDPKLEYQCFNEDSGTVRECKSQEPSGTSIRVDCKSPYFSRDDLQPIRCVEGLWDSVPICKEDCGRSAISSRLKRDLTTLRSDAPWYAAIYKKFETRSPQIICGGTLVSPIVIITAAHCFWDSQLLKSKPADDFVAGVGKIQFKWDDHKDGIFVQTFNIKDIKIPSRFLGTRTNYQNDIAVALLASPVEYNEAVQPACLDFDLKFDRQQLQKGSVAEVASWQYKSPRSSQGLQLVHLMYIEIDECLQKHNNSFQQFITADKICAERTPDSHGVCLGDSGSGLMFPDLHNGVERFYLRGVTSVAPHVPGEEPCNNKAPTAFTQIINNEHFLKDHL